MDRDNRYYEPQVAVLAIVRTTKDELGQLIETFCEDCYDLWMDKVCVVSECRLAIWTSLCRERCPYASPVFCRSFDRVRHSDQAG